MRTIYKKEILETFNLRTRGSNISKTTLQVTTRLPKNKHPLIYEENTAKILKKGGSVTEVSQITDTQYHFRQNVTKKTTKDPENIA